METSPRMPLQDLPLEPFLKLGIATRSKTPRRHKRPLSPSRTTLLNPAKRRVLDAEGIPHSNIAAVSSHSHAAPSMLSKMHTVTPSRPSRLGNRSIRNYDRPQGTPSPLPSYWCSPSHEFYSKPAIESSTDPQSRHYPGFDIFPDSGHRRDFSFPGVTQSFDDDAPVDRSEEDKENVPLRKRAKKPSSKKRISSGLDSSDVTSSQTSKVVVHPERTPLSARQAPR